LSIAGLQLIRILFTRCSVPAIGDCRFPIAEWLLANEQSAFGNWQSAIEAERKISTY